MYTKLKFFHKKTEFYILNYDIIDFYFFYIYKDTLHICRRSLWSQVEADFVSIGRWIGRDISEFCCENDVFLDESSPSLE